MLARRVLERNFRQRERIAGRVIRSLNSCDAASVRNNQASVRSA
jgi:hypothetical protein